MSLGVGLKQLAESLNGTGTGGGGGGVGGQPDPFRLISEWRADQVTTVPGILPSTLAVTSMINQVPGAPDLIVPFGRVKPQLLNSLGVGAPSLGVGLGDGYTSGQTFSYSGLYEGFIPTTITMPDGYNMCMQTAGPLPLSGQSFSLYILGQWGQNFYGGVWNMTQNPSAPTTGTIMQGNTLGNNNFFGQVGGMMVSTTNPNASYTFNYNQPFGGCGGQGAFQHGRYLTIADQPSGYVVLSYTFDLSRQGGVYPYGNLQFQAFVDDNFFCGGNTNIVGPANVFNDSYFGLWLPNTNIPAQPYWGTMGYSGTAGFICFDGGVTGYPTPNGGLLNIADGGFIATHIMIYQGAHHHVERQEVLDYIDTIWGHVPYIATSGSNEWQDGTGIGSTLSATNYTPFPTYSPDTP